MHKGRLEAFSDGVIAIIITIMVLELKVPHGTALADLYPLLPVLLCYLLSFIYVGIYWNNHHHLFQVVRQVSGSILWANLNLLFWLSLIPFTTGWMGENHFETIPVALYGFNLMMAGLSFVVLSAVLTKDERESELAIAIGKDLKGKISIALYIAGIALAFVHTWFAIALYVLTAAIWVVPDRRIEQNVSR